jgi:hypothetical protein
MKIKVENSVTIAKKRLEEQSAERCTADLEWSGLNQTLSQAC